jgi:hypothetical protein
MVDAVIRLTCVTKFQENIPAQGLSVWQIWTDTRESYFKRTMVLDALA